MDDAGRLYRNERTGRLDPNACTGTLIAEDLMVTAAHCIKHDPTGQRIAFTIDIGRPGATTRIVDGVEVPPGFHYGYAGANSGGDATMPKNNSDIALLHFSGGLPPGYHKANILPRSYQIKDGENLIAAGYAANVFRRIYDTDANGVIVNDMQNYWQEDGFGILRKATVPILDSHYAGTELQVKEGPRFFFNSGDSGGPVYISQGGELYLVGVNNWGTDEPTTQPQYEVFADVRAFSSWIDAAAARLRNTHVHNADVRRDGETHSATDQPFGDDFFAQLRRRGEATPESH